MENDMKLKNENEELKTKFGIRFKSLRTGYGFTQDTLAEAYAKKFQQKMLKSSISQYENGKQLPEVPYLINWAFFFNVTLDYLLGLSDVKVEHFILSIKDLEKVLKKLSYNDKKIAKQYLDELYNNIYSTHNSNIKILGQTAAGKPIEYGDSYAQDIDDISNIPQNADYALVVNGDSMEPDIKNGQIIYVKECPDVENGAIAIVEVDGAVTCKKVYKWNDHIELQSLNTAYEPIIITAGNFRILGKVII
mgnify:CR=1 FL=1